MVADAATAPRPTNFLGTTNDQTLEFRVNNDRALRLVPHPTSPNVVGGRFNAVTVGAFGASIGGGGSSLSINSVRDNYGTVAGGQGNRAGDNAGRSPDRPYATVGGGQGNAANGAYSTVRRGQRRRLKRELCPPSSGGAGDVASDLYGTVAGGVINVASGDSATVGVGIGNVASGDSAAIPGGNRNTASGSLQFRRRKAGRGRP